MNDPINRPLVSIIIPTYNRAKIITETLNSIINQTFQNWECLVIDDGSTDTTEEVMKKYVCADKRIHYYSKPVDLLRGGNAARNYGFKMSRGEYIHWFDSDDLMDKYNLDKKVLYLNSNMNCDYCICKVANFEVVNGKEVTYLKQEDLKISKDLYEDYILGKISILNVTPMWRRKIFNSQELYDESIFQLQDLDFYSRLIFKNKNIGIINETLIHVRRNNSSISTQNTMIKIDVNSFLKVKKRIIERTPRNIKILEYTLNTVLWAMRWKMAVRKYNEAGVCLHFCLLHLKKLPFAKKLNLIKVSFFFVVFKNLGKGDTKFKFLLKL